MQMSEEQAREWFFKSKFDKNTILTDIHEEDRFIEIGRELGFVKEQPTVICERHRTCKDDFCKHIKPHKEDEQCGDDHTCINKVPLLYINQMNGWQRAKCKKLKVRRLKNKI